MPVDYHDLARKGLLAPDFDQWGLRHPYDSSVGHEAARSVCLPPNCIRATDGWTVAHEAASHGALPSEFNRWDLADFDGYTVAHTAAEHGHLPSDFPHMDWADVDGLTVGEVYTKRVNASSTGKGHAQKTKNPMRTMVYDFSKVRPPKKPIDPEEVATLRRILRKYPCDIEDDRIRLHPELKVTPEERLILRKYLMAKGYHATKDAVAELDSMGDAMED